MAFGEIKRTIDVRFYLSDLMYCYKFNYKERYFKSLEKLKPYMDEALYDFFYNFGFNSTFFRKERVGYGK